MFEQRMQRFQARLAEAGIDVALITDDDNVYYLTGYYDYLHMEFGRPTILVVPKDGDSLLITPTIDLVMARGRRTGGPDCRRGMTGRAMNGARNCPGRSQGARRIAIEPAAHAADGAQLCR